MTATSRRLFKTNAGIARSPGHQNRHRRMDPNCTGDYCGNSLSDGGSSSSSEESESLSNLFVTLFNGNDSEAPRKLIPRRFDFGDGWDHLYSDPAGRSTKKPIRSGDVYTDSFLRDLPSLGYRPLQMLFAGSSATVIVVHDLANVNWAIVKLLPSKPKDESIAEAEIHRQLSHPHVVTFLKKLEWQDRRALVMEFCENGNMDQLLKVNDAHFISEPVARRYFRQLYSAVVYLHSQGVAHRDICTKNLLITCGNDIKVADFGHAVRYTTSAPLLSGSCGTVGFQAPEVLKKKPYNPFLTDLYSAGCVLYVMTIGKLPFGRSRDDVVTASEKGAKFPSEKVFILTTDLKDLLRGMLSLPEYRFSLNRIRHSQWMKTVDKSVHIGNFYRIRQPKKTKEGSVEMQMKAVLNI